MTDQSTTEGLPVARVLMVLSSLSPLFVLWAIRGAPVLADKWLILICSVLTIVPNLILFTRIKIARKRLDRKTLNIGAAEDHREYLLVYLFAVLLPFWAANLSNTRELAATITAFIFIVFLFWHLNMHYMNIFFAIFGYRIFTINPRAGGTDIDGRECIVLITQRAHLNPESELIAFRISNTVFIEMKE